MKSLIPSQPMMALAVVALCCQIAPVLMAQDSAPAPAKLGTAVTASTSETRPVQLSSGVADILKLVRAKVSDTITLSFIRNSGRTYHLSAAEILYLREQGVSDPVLTAMLDQQRNVAATAAQAVPQPASAYVAASPAYVQPSPAYVYSSPSYDYYDYGYYDSWPYYYGGYWGYPEWSFSLGYGGGYHGGGYHGGGHDGGYPGGSHGGGGRPGGQPGGGSIGGGHSGGGNPGGGHSGGGGGHR